VYAGGCRGVQTAVCVCVSPALNALFVQYQMKRLYMMHRSAYGFMRQFCSLALTQPGLISSKEIVQSKMSRDVINGPLQPPGYREKNLQAIYVAHACGSSCRNSNANKEKHGVL